MLCEKFTGYLSETSRHLILKLLLNLRSFSPSYLNYMCIDERIVKDVEQQLTVGGDPLLTLMLKESKQFHQILLSILPTSNGPSSAFSYHLLLLDVIQKIPSMSEDDKHVWMGQDNNILKIIFDNMDRCEAEFLSPMKFPGVMCKGRAQPLVDIYEYTVTHMCAFVTTLNNTQFQLVEKGLIDNILTDTNSFYRPLLAMDVWCFIARYGTPDLCYTHLSYLCKLLPSSLVVERKPCHYFIATLIKRLFDLITLQQKQRFYASHKSNVSLWCIVGLKSLPDSMRREMQGAMENSAMNGLKNNCSSENLMESLHCCRCLLESGIAQNSQLLSLIHNLWQSLNPQELHRNSLHFANHVIQELLTTTVAAAIYLDHQYVQIFPKIIQIVPNTNLSFKIQLTNLLKCLGYKYFQPTSSQPIILRQISQIFNLLFQEANKFVIQKTLEGFTSFAHTTKHEEVISNSIAGDSHLQHFVKNYIVQQPVDCSRTNYNIVDFVKEQIELCKTLPSPLSEEGPTLNEEEPPPKKTKLIDENNIDEQLLQVINNLQQSVDALDTFTVLPVWAHKDIESIVTKLQTYYA